MPKIKEKRQGASKGSSSFTDRPHNTGLAAKRLFAELLRDFQRTEGVLPSFDVATQQLFGDIKAFRDRDDRELGLVSPNRFKVVRQLENLLKKFRFADDAYTDDELSTRTLTKFLDEQLRLHKPMPLRTTGFMVLQRARTIAARILGEFPGDEVIQNLRFGRKSSIGCPLSLAYLDVKLKDADAFTGTESTFDYFLNQVLPGDPILQRILRDHDLNPQQDKLRYSHLKLVEVPKTWKVYRNITPLTLIGLFYSYGIGRVVQGRLAQHGLDITQLQNVHKKLIKAFSRNCRHATADLSAASDSITSELLNRVLPRRWYKALRLTFVRQLLVGGNRKISTASVLPMGNGATFPVETLVFYCIIRAIGDITGISGIYSVYGDDLIYPSKLHEYVVSVFPQIHLKLNLDKTFVRYPFRESCGSDYYRGVDVRSFYLRGQEESLTPLRYQAWLYKTYNGLRARWDEVEIPCTLSWILSELAMCSNAILRVPPGFPEYAGIRTSHPSSVPLRLAHLPFAPVTLQFAHGSRWFQFNFLLESAKGRKVLAQEPYYWLALQGLDDELADYLGAKIRPHILGSLASHAGMLPRRLVPSWFRECGSPVLNWSTVKRVKRYRTKDNRLVVKKEKKKIAVVASRTGATVSIATTRVNSLTGLVLTDWI